MMQHYLYMSRKILSSAALVFILAALLIPAGAAFAIDCGGPGGASCPSGQDCNIPPGQTGGTCVAAAGACTPACDATKNESCVGGTCVTQSQACNSLKPCPSGQFCNAIGVCGTTPDVSPTTGSGGSNAFSFVPLTNIPGLTNLSNVGTTAGLSAFLNQLYKLCIGAAAALAVLQIMRAGIMYMGGDSITEKKQAKTLIGLSIGGLILVLTPVIVFSIINPKILNLTIDTNSLKVPPVKLDPADMEIDPALKPTSDKICSLYTSPTWTSVPTNKSCSDVLGGGWVGLDPQCGCTGPAPAVGGTCCGLDKAYKAPAAKPGDTGTFSYSFSFKDAGSSKSDAACIGTVVKTFPSLTECQAAFSKEDDNFRSFNTLFAVGKTCSEAAEHTPVPSGNWSQFKSLPSCSY